MVCGGGHSKIDFHLWKRSIPCIRAAAKPRQVCCINDVTGSAIAALKIAGEYENIPA